MGQLEVTNDLFLTNGIWLLSLRVFHGIYSYFSSFWASYLYKQAIQSQRCCL